jgi:hypothetical protein
MSFWHLALGGSKELGNRCLQKFGENAEALIRKHQSGHIGSSEGWLEQGFVGSVHDIHSVDERNDIEIELTGGHLNAFTSKM